MAPTKKPAAKKAASKNSEVVSPASEKYKQFSVRQAQNGYILSIWDGEKDRSFVAKDKTELQALMRKHVKA